jgi:hypothetical protein
MNTLHRFRPEKPILRLSHEPQRSLALVVFLFALVVATASGSAVARAASPRPLQAELPEGCYELVVNGGFETLDSGWTTPAGPNQAFYDNSRAFAGNYSLRLGSNGGDPVASVSRAEQVVDLPADAATIILSFHYYGEIDGEPGVGDVQYLDIFDATSGAFITNKFQAQNDDRLWLSAKYSLTSLRGKQIRLAFGANNDGAGGQIAMWLDEVSVYYCIGDPSASPTPATGTPSVTPTNTPEVTGTQSPTPSTTPAPSGTPSPSMTPPPSTTPASSTTPSVTPTTSPTFVPTALPTFYPPLYPTVIPSVVPPPQGCSNLIQNGGFEANDAWYFGPTAITGGYVTSPVYAGARSARLGLPEGNGPDAISFSSVRQLVTLPANVASIQLHWWHLFRTQESPSDSIGIGEDRQELILLNPDLSTLAVLFRVRRNDGSFVREVTDLTAFSGRSVYIYFNAFNNANGLTTGMYVDEVTLCVSCCAPVPVPYSASPSQSVAVSYAAPSTVYGSEGAVYAPAAYTAQNGSYAVQTFAEQALTSAGTVALASSLEPAAATLPLGMEYPAALPNAQPMTALLSLPTTTPTVTPTDSAQSPQQVAPSATPTPTPTQLPAQFSVEPTTNPASQPVTAEPTQTSQSEDQPTETQALSSGASGSITTARGGIGGETIITDTATLSATASSTSSPEEANASAGGEDDDTWRRTTGIVAVLCGILLVVGMLATGIVRAIR